MFLSQGLIRFLRILQRLILYLSLKIMWTRSQQLRQRRQILPIIGERFHRKDGPR